MSEAFTPLFAPDVIAAANRIFERADKALSIARAFDGVSNRELLSIVIFVRQLDAIARAAAEVEQRCRASAWVPDPTTARALGHLAGLLLVPGYLPLPETQPAEEPAHGEG